MCYKCVEVAEVASDILGANSDLHIMDLYESLMVSALLVEKFTLIRDSETLKTIASNANRIANNIAQNCDSLRDFTHGSLNLDSLLGSGPASKESFVSFLSSLYAQSEGVSSETLQRDLSPPSPALPGKIKRGSSVFSALLFGFWSAAMVLRDV